MKQGHLPFPRQKYVVLTKDEDNSIRTAISRTYHQLELLENACIVPALHAVDWQQIYDITGRLQVETAVIKSATMQAVRGGQFRAHADPTVPVRPRRTPVGFQAPDDDPPF